MTKHPLKSKSNLSVGSNVNPLLPIGSIIGFFNVAALTSQNSKGLGNIWLRCNGATYNRADYPKLWAILQNANSSLHGNGTSTFTVPNLQDTFLEAASWSTASNSTAGQKTNSSFPSHTGSSGNSGSMLHYHNSGNESVNHQHNWGNSHNDGNPSNRVGGSWANINTSGQSHNHTISVGGATSGVYAWHTHGFGNSDVNLDHSHGINHSHTFEPPVHYNMIFGIKAI
jgi:microcystin-dependent protein